MRCVVLLLSLCAVLCFSGCGRPQDVAQVEDPSASGWWLAITEGSVEHPVVHGSGDREIALDEDASPICLYLTRATSDGGVVRVRILERRSGLAPDKESDWAEPESVGTAKICYRVQ